MPNIAELYNIDKKNGERTRLLLQRAEQLDLTSLDRMDFYGADINNEDIAIAIQYMMDIIHCQDIEPTCGTHIGCSECLSNHFKMTVFSAFKKVRLLERENEELRKAVNPIV